MESVRRLRALLKSMPKTSYPKHQIRVLLLENIHPEAAARFRAETFQVESLPSSLREDELCKKIETVHLLGIRSQTRVTEAVLQHARRLWAIGCYCIGTEQVNLVAARRRGIVVFNAPYSNTRSVAELVIGEIIMLLRRVWEKSQSLNLKIWDKSAVGCYEMRGKILGIVGYGHIGSQVSVLAEALGMDVIYYDIAEKLPLGTARPMPSLEALLTQADIVTLHVPEDETTINMIAGPQLAMMKKGSYLLNTSRGRVVNLADLREALVSGHLAGAALDVFPNEPANNGQPFESDLLGLPNVILTPHIGGSTLESQQDIARKTTEKLITYMNNGSTIASVNFPEVQLPLLKDQHRVLHIHQNIPGVIAEFNSVFSKHQINIEGQYLRTQEEVGYVVTDINRLPRKEVVDDLKKMPATIRVRVLY
ncbi:MAG: phosphoglycerate dehydrogenase [candidate division KSB1 bacterium]|nr:phosphoglycerate dehydrogenase [candidate division KSB1 bacterium]